MIVQLTHPRAFLPPRSHSRPFTFFAYVRYLIFWFSLCSRSKQWGFLTILVVYSLLLVLALGIGKMVLVVGGVEPGDGSYFVFCIKSNEIY